jgi:hypothetical protein
MSAYISDNPNSFVSGTSSGSSGSGSSESGSGSGSGSSESGSGSGSGSGSSGSGSGSGTSGSGSSGSGSSGSGSSGSGTSGSGSGGSGSGSGSSGSGSSGSGSESGSGSYEDYIKKILDKIQYFQNKEQDIITELEKNIANNTLTDDLKESLINQIEELTEMRINLYRNLNENSQNTIDNLYSSDVLSGHQGQTIIIIENELNQTKSRLEELNNLKTNNLRMVQINKYYGDKYQDQSYLMMVVIIICIVIIIIKFLHNKNIIPDALYAILLVIILTIGFIVVFWKMVYLYSHDNFDYNKYKWAFNSETAPKIDTTGGASGQNPWKLSNNTNICPGSYSYCGSGTVYDSTENKCVSLNTGSSSIDYTSLNSAEYENFSLS